MTKTIVMGSLLGVWFAMAASGCEIHSCEEGANCGGAFSDDGPDVEAHEQCIRYCARVSVCGGPQADDIDACIEACEERFEILPEETAELCECAPRSSCEDVNEGRCSEPGAGGRGGSSAGGSSNQGGAYSTGGSSTQGGSSSGGAPSSGGSSSGGAPSSGGSSAGGAPPSGGSSSGGSHTCTGGTSSGGTDAGGAGGDTGACTCDCDCGSGERCVDGACTA